MQTHLCVHMRACVSLSGLGCSGEMESKAVRVPQHCPATLLSCSLLRSGAPCLLVCRSSTTSKGHTPLPQAPAVLASRFLVD